MTKQEQINTLIDRLEKLESEYTRLHEEQRRDMLDNLERYGKTIRLFDKHNRDIDRLNTIVERLDELLAKGIYEYIMGKDGVEGLKDMWERSAVMAFAEKLRKRLTADRASNDNVVINANYEIDELLKELKDERNFI